MSNKINSYLINNLFNSSSHCIFFNNNINLINYLFLIAVNSFTFIINRVLVTNTNFTEYRKKTLASTFEQLVRCGIYSTFVFLLSNLSKNYNNIIAITSFITSIIYTVISQYLVFNISDINNMDIGALIISCLFILILLATVILNFYKANKCQHLVNYIILILITILLIVPYYLLPRHNKEYVHLHHWYFCMILALLIRYDGLVNNIMIGILLGLMVQGLSSYGDDFIMERQIFLNKYNNSFSFIDNNFDFDRDTYFKIVVKK
jgi:hypothetical protein